MSRMTIAGDRFIESCFVDTSEVGQKWASRNLTGLVTACSKWSPRLPPILECLQANRKLSWARSPVLGSLDLLRALS